MRRHDEFSRTTRLGRRVRSGAVVIHHVTASFEAGPARVGFVVGKSVGNSVVRHRVVRQLRAQTVPLLAVLPAGSTTVVRALPPAATATSVALSNDLRSAWRRVIRGPA